MKRCILYSVVALAAIVVLGNQHAQSSDDISYATPVALEDSPACAGHECCETRKCRVTKRHWPVVRWFQNHRPVLRTVRCAARLVIDPGCRD